jgi:hypothetical protein
MAGMVLNTSHWVGDKIVSEDEEIVLFFVYKNYETALKKLDCHTKCHARFFILFDV